MKETILLFHVNDRNKRLKIEMALFPLKVRVRYVKEEEYGQKLGFLAGNPEVPAEPITDGDSRIAGPGDTMIVFAFLDDTKLNQCLTALRKSGAGSLPYKAVLTPTNQYWTPLQCFEEIKSEHEIMSQKKQDV